MARPLSSFPAEKREEVAHKRAGAVENGLGKLSAQDFLNRKQPKAKAVKVAEVKSE